MRKISGLFVLQLLLIALCPVLDCYSCSGKEISDAFPEAACDGNGTALTVVSRSRSDIQAFYAWLGAEQRLGQAIVRKYADIHISRPWQRGSMDSYVSTFLGFKEPVRLEVPRNVVP